MLIMYATILCKYFLRKFNYVEKRFQLFKFLITMILCVVSYLSDFEVLSKNVLSLITIIQRKVCAPI